MYHYKLFEDISKFTQIDSAHFALFFVLAIIFLLGAWIGSYYVARLIHDLIEAIVILIRGYNPYEYEEGNGDDNEDDDPKSSHLGDRHG